MKRMVFYNKTDIKSLKDGFGVFLWVCLGFVGLFWVFVLGVFLSFGIPAQTSHAIFHMELHRVHERGYAILVA